MAFSTKQILSNQKFAQPTGNTLSLSGTTFVRDLRMIGNKPITGSTQYVTKTYIDDRFTTGTTFGTVTGATNGIKLTGGGRKLGLGGIVTGATTITLGTNNLILSGTTGTLRYSTDLSAQYNVRSVVDKGYVTGITNTLQTKSSIATLTGTTLPNLYISGATNGLSKQGRRVRLGGNLTGSTTIGLGTNNLTFTGTTGTLRYGSDLSAQYNVRSIVDKGYVTGLTNTLLAKSLFNTYSGSTLQKEISATTYTVTLNDHSYAIYFTNPAGCLVTIPNLGIGKTFLGIRKEGAGTVTFTGSSVALKAAGTQIPTSKTAASWVQKTTGEWYGFGSFNTTGTTASGTITGATNGLRVTGTKLKLGGTLTGATTIGLGSNNLIFTGTTGTLRYGSDLSAQYNVRSLVDRGYVTGITNTLLAKTLFNTYTGSTSQKEVTATTYTVTLNDHNYMIYFTNVAGTLVTIPNLGVGKIFGAIRKEGAGIVTFTGSSVALKAAGNQLLSAKTSASWVQKTTGEWYGFGAFVSGSSGGGSGTITGATNGLRVTGAKLKLGGNLTGTTTIGLTTNNLIFTGTTGTLRYGSDLSAQYNIRSLVDRGYVTGITNTLLAKTLFNTYTGNTATSLNGKLNTSNFNTYSGLTNTRLTTVENNYVTGYTSLGNNSLITTKSGKNLQFKGLAAGTNITLTPTSTGITISASGGGGSGTITGATNGLRLSGGGKRTALGGNLTGSTTIGLGTSNLTFTGTTGTLRYGSDLSAQYNVRSIVDKGYVTGLTNSLSSVYQSKTSINTLTGTTLPATYSTKAALIKTVGSSNYVVTSADLDYIIEFTGSTNRNCTFTASGLTANFRCTINNLMASNTVTVVAGPSTTLQLTGTILASQYAGASLYCNGNNIRGFGNLS